MNRCFTTMGYYEENRISADYSSPNPLISREEQIKRLEALKSVKWTKYKTQMSNSLNHK